MNNVCIVHEFISWIVITAIVRERHPMPTADKLIHKLNGAKVFSKLDLRHGYHQILLAPESRTLLPFALIKAYIVMFD